MSMITAAYSYTSLSISQLSTAEADADTKGSAATAIEHFHRAQTVNPHGYAQECSHAVRARV